MIEVDGIYFCLALMFGEGGNGKQGYHYIHSIQLIILYSGSLNLWTTTVHLRREDVSVS